MRAFSSCSLVYSLRRALIKQEKFSPIGEVGIAEEPRLLPAAYLKPANSLLLFRNLLRGTEAPETTNQRFRAPHRCNISKPGELGARGEVVYGERRTINGDLAKAVKTSFGQRTVFGGTRLGSGCSPVGCEQRGKPRGFVDVGSSLDAHKPTRLFGEVAKNQDPVAQADNDCARVFRAPLRWSVPA